jgi:hypothetical protein
MRMDEIIRVEESLNESYKKRHVELKGDVSNLQE